MKGNMDYQEVIDGINEIMNREMGMFIFPDYTQDNDLWIELQDYQHEDWHQLVMLLKVIYAAVLLYSR